MMINYSGVNRGKKQNTRSQASLRSVPSLHEHTGAHVTVCVCGGGEGDFHFLHITASLVVEFH